MRDIIIWISGLSAALAILTIAIFVAGTILGIVLSILMPVILFFTGIGMIQFLMTDYSKEKPDTKQ